MLEIIAITILFMHELGCNVDITIALWLLCFTVLFKGLAKAILIMQKQKEELKNEKN